MRYSDLGVKGAPPEVQLGRARFGSSRLWSFITTAGSQQVDIGCAVLFPRGTADAEVQEETRQAGAEFVAMLNSLSIQAK